MLESLKKKLWDFLKEKQVSLVMLFDSDGKILWNKGREISGKRISNGHGFPKTHIISVLKKNQALEENNIIVTSYGEKLPQSAKILDIKSLLIQPLGHDLFLYVDSGNKDYFTISEIEIFKAMGELLSETITKIKNGNNRQMGICGKSKAIENIKSLVLKYAVEEDPVFILGENGCGKSYIAKLIHDYSGRSGEFVIVNTPSLPEALLESEIFGYRKGAHSEAKFDKPGLVEVAKGGTVFFDEIAEIPINLQAKLLQFIETKTYRMLGDLHDKTIDVRICAATNKDLKVEIKEKRFREDLFFRLNVLPLEIPPLRKRKEDIREFVDIFKKYLKGKKLTQNFWNEIFKYNWPGNIRELESVLKRAGIQVDGDEIGEEIHDIIKTIDCQDDFYEDSDMKFVEKEILEGKSFFDTAWKLFMKRDINRREIKAFLHKYYEKNDRSLTKTAAALNIKCRYNLFVKYLHEYKIHPNK